MFLIAVVIGACAWRLRGNTSAPQNNNANAGDNDSSAPLPEKDEMSSAEQGL